MTNSLDTVLRKFRGWYLFKIIFTAITGTIIIGFLMSEFGTREQTQFMIILSVRCSLPWFLLTLIASSLRFLYPSSLTKWLLANRKFFGLCFAYGMGWQLVFIFRITLADNKSFLDLFTGFFDFFFASVYLFLLAMTLTSFNLYRRKISSKAWKVIHKTGLYMVWITITYSYVYRSIFDPSIDVYILAIAFVSAYVVRILGWLQKRGILFDKAIGKNGGKIQEQLSGADTILKIKQ